MNKCYPWLLFCVLWCSCKNSKEKIFPEKKVLTESVYSSVTVQPDSLYQIYTAVGGILDYLLVEEGDSVYAGQPIMQIINNTPKLNTENTRLTFNLAKEQLDGKSAILDELKKEVASASLKLKNDSINFFRQKSLWDQQIGSKVEFDTKKLAYELSANTFLSIKNKYARTKQELETQLKQAENNYRASQITTTDFTVKSKINGKVYALLKNPGETVSPQEPLGAIGRSDQFVLEMLIDEVDIVKLKKGQKTLVTLDAYNSRVFEAQIHKIYPRKDERNQTFKVEALFIDAPSVLYPGLSGEGNIIIDQKDNALTIPKEYLIDGNKVQTQKGLVTIVTGLQNLDYIEIISGIDEKTPIYKPQ